MNHHAPAKPLGCDFLKRQLHGNKTGPTCEPHPHLLSHKCNSHMHFCWARGKKYLRLLIRLIRKHNRQYEFEEDDSWSLEWKNFKNAINSNMNPNGDGYDGYHANKIIEAIYTSDKENKPVSVN